MIMNPRQRGGLGLLALLRHGKKKEKKITDLAVTADEPKPSKICFLH
jgi:hypothetical protein